MSSPQLVPNLLISRLIVDNFTLSDIVLKYPLVEE